MKIQEEMFRDILQRAESSIERRAAGDDFRRVLLMHIVEAAVGLDVPAASVNASEKERSMISEDILREAENRVKTLTVSPNR